jgi:hypothetical protein
MGKRGKMTDTLFKQNWTFSEKYMPQVKQILSKHAGKFLQIEVATMEEDMTLAFDLNIIAHTKNKISVRIRRAEVKFRDITIRSLNGVYDTEIHKLRKGYGDWYLYAWEGSDGRITEYALIDIHKARQLFMEDRNTIPNTDGKTGFYCYSLAELAVCGALVAYETRN